MSNLRIYEINTTKQSSVSQSGTSTPYLAKNFNDGIMIPEGQTIEDIKSREQIIRDFYRERNILISEWFQLLRAASMQRIKKASRPEFNAKIRTRCLFLTVWGRFNITEISLSGRRNLVSTDRWIYYLNTHSKSCNHPIEHCHTWNYHPVFYT